MTMAKIKRHFLRRKLDDVKLKRLWPSRMTDSAIAKQMGTSRGSVRRRAIKIGLPLRRELWAHQP